MEGGESEKGVKEREKGGNRVRGGEGGKEGGREGGRG